MTVSTNQPLNPFAVNSVNYPQFLPWLRAPNSSDIYNAGTKVQDNSVIPPVIYETTGAGVWLAGSGAGNVTSVTGTANQLTASPTTGAVILSLSATLLAPGSIASTTTMTAGTTVTATLGNITATNGDLVLATAGNKLSIATGSNASTGTATLTGGTVTVATTAVTAQSLIHIWRQSIGATGAAATGNLTVGTVTAGTSFVINSVEAADATALQPTDVSVIGWQIVN